jgi:hypothetical protein
MTKFVGVAKGSRNKRVFASTEQPSGAAELANAVVPEAPKHRVALALACDAAPLGAPLLLSLFDDRVPETSQAFRERCASLERALLTSVLPGVALEFTAAVANGRRPSLENASLRHDRAGLLSVSADGTRFSLLLAACPTLDGRQQVVGEVCGGQQTLAELALLQAGDDKSPVRRVLVCAVGCIPDGEGGERVFALEHLAKAQAACRAVAEHSESAGQTRARLDAESRAKRGEVEAAVSQALHQAKRLKKDGRQGAAAGMLASLFGGDDSDLEEE